MSAEDTRTAPPEEARSIGGLLLWFAVLGGAVAWAVHLILAWGIDESACARGESHALGLPLRGVLTLSVVLPGLVALAALGAAVLAWRRLRGAAPEAGRRVQRANFMAVFAVWADLVFLAIIVFGGIAVAVLPACRSTT
jgi:hypothetical protein